MTKVYVVTEPCVECRYTDCIPTCPVDAFHLGPDAVVINPDVCIGCGACEPACPVEAIFEISEISEEQEVWIDINKVFSGAEKPGRIEDWPKKLKQQVEVDDFEPWPVETEQQPP